MKRAILTFTLLLFCFLANIYAQNPVVTLEHGQQTSIYYGPNALVEANTAAVNGDAIYLSSGSFTGITITKLLSVTGVGHYPDPVNLYSNTVVSGISFGQGSDSSKIEGLYINGNVEFAADKPLSKINVNRCCFQDYKFNSNAVTASKYFCSITQSVIRGYVYCSNFCNNFHINNCILNGRVTDVIGTSSCYLENNIFLMNWGSNHDWDANYLFRNIYNSIIRNNIIFQRINDYYYGYILLNSGTNYISNNIFQNSNFDFGTNLSQNNWFGVAQSSLFVKQSGNGFDYNHDYHLKEPEKYKGYDGTEVGIYGGIDPYKEKALPINPHVVSKDIPFKTDAKGNLLINMTVKAQDK